MRAGLIIICCSFILTGCKNKNKIPAGVIPQKKMQAVLWDMMRADQFLADFVPNKDSGPDKNAEKINLYRQVFAIHHISKEQFGESFSFYRNHPALFEIIMDSLSRTKTEAPTEAKKPIRQDSIAASLRKRSRADSLIHLQKKKIIPLN
jgi:Domain of unknown function (DUF4296)